MKSLEKNELPPCPQTLLDPVVHEQVLQEAYQRAEQARRAKNGKKQRILSYRFVAWAASILLAITLSVPFVVAKNAYLRAQVRALMMSLDAAEGVARFTWEKDDQAAFDVPAGWKGLYYPSYIPAGFRVAEIEDVPDWVGNAYLLFRNEAEGKISFREYSEGTVLTVGTEQGTMSQVRIGEREATHQASDDGTFFRLVWQGEVRWFVLEGSYVADSELIKMAESVRMIVTE